MSTFDLRRWLEVPWHDLRSTFAWAEALHHTPQDPVHHAEGDVGLHTSLVVDAMRALPAFRALPDEDRAIALAAAVLHDVAKPETTRIAGDGRVTSAGHSTRGAIRARRILWGLGVPFAAREAAVALVRHHQVPFWLLERDDPRALLARVTQTARADLLAVLAEADARGRTCHDQARLLDAVALFRAYAEEQGCLATPFAFPSEHTRFAFFQGALRDPSFAKPPPWAEHGARGAPVEAVLLSGLPGAGKDHVVASHFAGWPVVSLDRLRVEIDVSPEDAQGAVVQAARAEARAHLRAGRSFVWNATNVGRQLRAACVRLFADYGARVRIVHVEAPEPTLRAANRARPGRAAVPDAVIDRLLDRWEVPDPTEAHEVTYVVRS